MITIFCEIRLLKLPSPSEPGAGWCRLVQDLHRAAENGLKRLKVNYAQRVEKFKLRLAGQREASKRRWIKKYFNGVEPELPWTTCAEMLSRNAEQGYNLSVLNLYFIKAS